MKLETVDIDIGARAPIVILHEQDAEELGVHPLDRVHIEGNTMGTTAIVDVTAELVAPGIIGLSRQLDGFGETVNVSISPKPTSVRHIRRKLDDQELERDELASIIHDIHQNRLNDVELGAYVSGVYANGLSRTETTHLTEVMTDIGKHIAWDDGVIADKHSIGGVAGNRVTPIIVPIVAAAGVKIPKTSSRAITSPAGTADTMEVLCDVDFSLDEIKAIVEETNGCMVSGGSVDLSPVDDKIVRAENPLSLDPEGQVIASVLSKKKSAGSTHIIIDIPYGEGSKVDDLPAGRDLAADFKRVGSHLDMSIECTITRGSQPIGRGIGPVLEARDILKTLQGDGPEDLRLKSVRLADILFELVDVDADAADILASGQALDKFREIIAAQNGDPDVSVDDLEPGSIQETVTAGRAGYVTRVDNELISEIARRAGAPKDKGAGLVLHQQLGDEVSEGDRLYTVYAEKTGKMDDAQQRAAETDAVRVGGKEESLVERV